jgi:hypothetical protein
MFEDKISYKGFTYRCFVDADEDVIKTYHSCIGDNDFEKSMPFSPYYTMNLMSFAAWIDMGMPSYEEIDNKNIISFSDLGKIKRLLEERKFIACMDDLLNDERKQ